MSDKLKREHGSGSVTKRTDGSWTARIQIGTQANGKPKIKAFYGKTESEVKKKLKEFIRNINNLPQSEIKKISFEAYIKNWLYTYKYNELKAGSFDRLESTINTHVIPNIGYLQLHSIKQDDIQILMNKLLAKGLSYSSIKKIYEAVNACFKHALIKDDVLKNPVVGIKLPSQSRFQKKEISVFSDITLKLFYQELDKKYATGKPVYLYPDAYILILNTGLRMGEALALKWEDVDLQDKSIHIRRNAIIVKTRNPKDITEHTGYSNIIQDSTKTYSGDRVIHLNKKAFASISNLYEANGKYDFVICNSLGKPVPAHNFERTFYRIIENCGIEKCGVHTLRHTFASMLFKRGADVKAVSEILGHSKVSITYDTYIHLIKEQRKDAIELLDDE